ncbi:hypothetical protein RRG08_054623 [Elysia crispata]|uniref:dolichol kinase n=1 Tax=Elysia crispata TaxID=231223 RepID=A0AAE1E8N6_9GAST|nr:hypothetical protein RRG08_054623 [Elysia crispata]
MDFYNILASVTTLYITYNYALTEKKAKHHWTISGTILMDLFLLLLCSGDVKQSGCSNKNYRPAAHNGIFLTIAIPMIHMGELVADHNQGDDSLVLAQLWLSLGSVSSVIARWLWVGKETSKVCLSFLIISSGMIMIHLSSSIAFFLYGVDFLIVWSGLKFIPIWLPRSFTFGELAIVLQLLVGFINRFAFGCLESSWLVGETFPLLMFTTTLLVTVVAATCVTYVTFSHLSVWRFILTYVLFAAAALGFLHVTCPETPLLWLLHFTMKGCKRIWLVTTWFLILAITFTWTANQSFVMKQVGSSSNETISYPWQISSSHIECLKNVSAKFTSRKMFHIYIVLVYIPGLIVDPTFLFLASIVVFSLFIIVEAARAWKVPVIGPCINDIQLLFVDERDQGHIFLTHFYLLLGMSLPLWLSPMLFSTHQGTLEMYAGVLALGVGDTVACLSGRAIGFLHWPGSKKTIEGSICSIIAQMVLIAAGSFLGVVKITSMFTAFTGVIMAALAEAFTDQIDNLILPLVLLTLELFSPNSIGLIVAAVNFSLHEMRTGNCVVKKSPCSGRILAVLQSKRPAVRA